MKIVKRKEDNGIHEFWFDDDYDTWVAITPSSHSWEIQNGDDSDTYMSGNYVTDGNDVIDYDGCYGELPVAVILALSDMDYDIDL